jgi:hypothetical protein
MKYLKNYNESIRSLMTPKSEEEILKSLNGLSNSELLKKSIDNEFVKGVELALQNKLTNADIEQIKYKIFEIKNKELVKLLLDKVKDRLTEDQNYIIEKYKLGLHQDELKDYEIWFKNIIHNIYEYKKYNDIIKYKSNNYLLSYDIINKAFFIDNKIWSVFKLKYHLVYCEIKLLIKYIIKKQLNLNEITIHII